MVVFIGKSCYNYNETQRVPPIRTGPLEIVYTKSCTLKAGEDVFLKTFNPEKTQIFDYSFEWTKISEGSMIDFSTHGIKGQFGGDGVYGNGWCRPAKNNSVIGDGQKNTRVFYVRIKNSGDDSVSFNFHLWGYRILPPLLETEPTK